MFLGWFLRAFSLTGNIKDQFRFKFWMRWSHVYIFGLMVMISANNIHGVGYFFLLIYNERLENIMEALLWLRWFVFGNVKKVCAMCWYSRWRFDVHDLKYVWYLHLCVDDCSFGTLGISPRSDSVSPYVCRIMCIILYRFGYFCIYVRVFC